MRKVPYASAVGSLMYLMVCTRPDLAYYVSMVSRFMSNPGEKHWLAVKWILRYIKGTKNVGLMFDGQNDGKELVCRYVDLDHARSIDTRKSMTGYIFAVNGTAISWKATLQPIVAMSSTEAEYVAVIEAFKEGKWMNGFMKELGFGQKSVTVYCDSQSAIHLSKHQVFHERTKHIDVRLHFVRDIIDSGELQIQKISTYDNPSDMCTKVIPKERFLRCMEAVNVAEATIL